MSVCPKLCGEKHVPIMLPVGGDGVGGDGWIIGTYPRGRGRGQTDYRNMAELRRPRPPPGLSEHGFSYFIIDFSSLMCIMIFIVESLAGVLQRESQQE